jgi:hypothetical protein
MVRKILLLVFISLLIGVASASTPRFVTAQPPETQVSQSWEKAVVYLPRTSKPSSIDQIKTDKAYPVAIFMHGCGGIESNSDNHDWAKLLASEGLLVVMPNSLARTDRKPSCDPKTKRAGLFPAVHGMRLEEIKYASEQIRKQTWFDGKNLFLMGFSEGATAAVRTKLSGFRGVIATSWTCTNARVPHLTGFSFRLKLRCSPSLMRKIHGLPTTPEAVARRGCLVEWMRSISWFPAKDMERMTAKRRGRRLFSSSSIFYLLHDLVQAFGSPGTA